MNFGSRDELRNTRVRVAMASNINKCRGTRFSRCTEVCSVVRVHARKCVQELGLDKGNPKEACRPA